MCDYLRSLRVATYQDFTRLLQYASAVSLQLPRPSPISFPFEFLHQRATFFVLLIRARVRVFFGPEFSSSPCALSLPISLRFPLIPLQPRDARTICESDCEQGNNENQGGSRTGKARASKDLSRGRNKPRIGIRKAQQERVITGLDCARAPKEVKERKQEEEIVWKRA